MNGKLGLTQAEAVMDLISADGRQGAALANAALGGALAKKINAQKAQLTALQAHLAAWVDFPEEDVPELDPAHLRTVLGAVPGRAGRPYPQLRCRCGAARGCGLRHRGTPQRG